MRDLLIIGIIGWLAAGGLAHPWVGIMGWTWISLMNPHRLSWRLGEQPVALVFALATFVGLLFTKDRRHFFVCRESAVLMAFMAWMSFVYLFFALYPDDSNEMWRRTLKIDLMVLVTMVVLHNRRHIVAFVWVIAISIGFYGFKGGIFTILHGGSYRVWGPEQSFIEGNNEVALAFIMTIPLIRFLQLQVASKRLKQGLGLWMMLCAIAALGSQSRGALLALFAMAVVMWARSQRKLISAVVFVVVGAAMIGFMPKSWTQRMDTIGTYQQDSSAQGRINAWIMTWNLAKDHPTGGSYSIYKPATFAMYAPDPTDIHVAHSIYFQLLGEQGYLGLLLFLMLWAMTWGTAGKLRKEGLKRPETKWLSDLGAMCQVSVAGYAVGGAFLSLAYFDLPYNIMVLVVLGRNWIKDQGWVMEQPLGQGRWARFEAWLGMGRV